MTTIYLPAGVIDYTPKKMCSQGLNKANRTMETAERKERIFNEFLSIAKTANNRAKRNEQYKLKRQKP